MVACEFEYRRRFWMITLVYVLAYAFYNLDHLNIVYAIVLGNQGVVQKDMLVRFLYIAAALLAVCGAVLLTWQWLTGLITPARIARPFRLVARFDTSEICITCPLLSCTGIARKQASLGRQKHHTFSNLHLTGNDAAARVSC